MAKTNTTTPEDESVAAQEVDDLNSKGRIDKDELFSRIDEVHELLLKASGIVHLIGLGKFDVDPKYFIQNAAWAAYGFIDEARRLLGDEE